MGKNCNFVVARPAATAVALGVATNPPNVKARVIIVIRVRNHDNLEKGAASSNEIGAIRKIRVKRSA